MHLFWDTSAVVPLIFQEPNSGVAQRAAGVTRRAFAWSWMRVEAEAALLRRGATTQSWQELSRLLSAFIWLNMNPGEEGAVCQFNRPLGLRASDAGHLYVLSKAVSADPSIRLVTFDLEMQSAAAACALPLWIQ